VTPDDVLALFRLPAAAVLNRRVAKDDLSAQLAKSNDRTLVKQRVEALTWHAGLNQTNTGLPPEGITGLAIVTLVTRPRNAAPDTPAEHHHPPARLVSLIHRTVPDPLILLTACETPDGPQATSLSIKPALGDALSAELEPVDDALPPDAGPLLAVDRAASLSDLHRRWSDAVLGLVAYKATEHFPTPREGGDIKDRREALDRLLALDREIITLTQQARRETQAGRRAELNERLQRARRERQAVAEAL
jgi:hypothetical protein